MTPIKIGQNAATLETSPAFEPFSRVTLIVGTDENGDEVSYTAGDDTGRELTAKCPWATQAIVDNLLAEVSGYAYQPYAATDALLDPAAELGDAVSVGGVVSVLGSIETTLDALYTADVAAPQDEEIDHEYPYEPQPERTAARKAATVTAELRVMGDTISSKVSSAEAQTLITQNLNSITLSASAGSNQSTVTISANGIDVKSAIVSFSSIVADSVKASWVYAGNISADQITAGTIAAESITGLKGKLSLLSENNTVSGYFGAYSFGSRTYVTMQKNDTLYVGLTDYGGHDDIVCMADNMGIYADLYIYQKGLFLSSGYGYGTLAQRNALTPTMGRIFFVRQ